MVLMKSYRRAPAILVVGALSAFLSSAPISSAETLAEQLFAEGKWQQCRSECLRLLATSPDNSNIQLTSLQAQQRMGKNVTDDMTALADSTKTPQELRCEASYELALIHLDAKHSEDALDRLIYCFNHTKSGQLFAASTRKANTILNNNPALEEKHQELVSIIRTASRTWPRNRNVSADKSTWLPANPAMLVISFYRSQISPAIGARCSLHPSCSQYAVESLKKHPIAGIGLTGDRMIREPDVVDAKDKPIVLQNKIKYSDPVSDHDFWMKDTGK